MQRSISPRSGLVFKCFGSEHTAWFDTQNLCFQSFPNFLWWTPAAFSGIFAHRSKTVTLGECQCSYLGTALPSFLAQNRKNKALFSPLVLRHLLRFEELCHLSVGITAVWRHHVPAQINRNAHPHEPTKALSVLMAMSSSHPIVPTASVYSSALPPCPYLACGESVCHHPMSPADQKGGLGKKSGLSEAEQRGAEGAITRCSRQWTELGLHCPLTPMCLYSWVMGLGESNAPGSQI